MILNLNTKCPFQPGTMITAPEKFWGRAYEKTTLISRLQNMGSSVINGERRIGKSSLAYFVYTYCKSNLPDYEPIWIDCQNIHTKSVDGLFQQIKANSSLDYSSGKTKQECLKNFVSTVSASGKKIVIFIDEFELLTDASHKKQFDESFYLQLRMLAAQGGNFALVLVSKEPLQEICKHTLGISSPFYNILDSCILAFLA
jgi:Cdc6-like AAA superfamily ATPase